MTQKLRKLHKLRQLTLCLLTLFLAAAALHAEPIRVRQSQGTERGFLLIRSEGGVIIGHGDLFQNAHGAHVTTELVLHFKDGSLDDETATYTQNGVFHLLSDHHIQKGPAYHNPVDILVESSGKVTTRSLDKDGKVTTQHLKLPADLANGMIGPLIANLLPTTPPLKLGMVAPDGGKGRLVHLAISNDSTAKFTDVGLTYTATIFRIHIDLGGIAGVVAPLVGKQPGDLFVWIAEGTTPQFVRLVGPLAEGSSPISVELSGATFNDTTPPTK